MERNVQSLFESEKTHHTIQEMNRPHIDILRISEVRWPSSGKMIVCGITVFYSGNDYVNHKNGEGIILNKRTEAAVINFVS